MKLLIAILLFVATLPMNASEIDWKAVRIAEAQNQKTVKELMTKAGVAEDGSNWSPKLLKQKLEIWEYHFMLASGFDAVANNGGLVHGLHCYFDDEEGSDLHVPKGDMLACWKATGSNFLIKAHAIGQRELTRYGVTKYDDLTGEQEEELEETLDEAYERDGDPFEVRLAAFARKNKSGEPSGSGQPAKRTESKSEGSDKPQPDAEGRSR